MSSSSFSFEMDNGKLVWTYPAHALNVNEEQARTVAMLLLGNAVEKLAAAVERLADSKQAVPLDLSQPVET